ncbi:MAG: hypothetical protein HY873_04075 [Chloroflexi bacterium]|nr:hypothetical protein [Chloroflexota bacterium]
MTRMFDSMRSLAMRHFQLSLCLALIAQTEGTLHAQCLNYSSQFPFSNGLPGGGETWDMVVHDVGNGPELFVGGEFNASSGRHVAKWNGTSWTGFANGPGQASDWVAALEFFDDGAGERLYAGGSFSIQLPGSSIWHYYNFASWNGTSWEPVPGWGTWPGAQVLDLTVFDDGSGPALYAAGAFNVTGQYGIARYLPGVGWTSLGTGGADSWLTTLAVFDDGSGPALYAAGNFTQIGGVSAYHIARWNGTSWVPVGTPSDNINPVRLVPFDDGTGPALYASSSGPNKIVRWNGLAWSGVPGWPSSMFGLPLGTFDSGQGRRLIVNSNNPAAYEWNGSAWAPSLTEVQGIVYCMTEYDDGHGGGPSLYFTGQLGRVAGMESWRIGALRRSCVEPVDTMCFGDGTVATCPCLNQGLRGNGCANSVAPSGARLSHSGLPTNDTLALTTINQPANSATIVLQATEAVQTRTPFGDGLLCLGGRLVRLFTRTASNGSIVVPGPGDPTLRDRSAQRGDPLVPGNVRYYQAYYRDVDAAFCPAPTGGTSNMTNGVRVVW